MSLPLRRRRKSECDGCGSRLRCLEHNSFIFMIRSLVLRVGLLRRQHWFYYFSKIKLIIVNPYLKSPDNSINLVIFNWHNNNNNHDITPQTIQISTQNQKTSHLLETQTLLSHTPLRQTTLHRHSWYLQTAIILISSKRTQR